VFPKVVHAPECGRYPRNAGHDEDVRDGLRDALQKALMRRRFADVLLFAVTLTELAILVPFLPTFTFVDWIYVSQHLLVLGIAFTRPQPQAQDYSLQSSVASIVSMTYPYAQVVCLKWTSGHLAWPAGGLVLVTVGAFLSLASLLSLGRSFGILPAWRRLVRRGPYHLVRHPMYLSYLLADVGYNLQEWNYGTVLLVLAGWASLVYRINAEERVLSQDAEWPTYAAAVPYRLLPGLW
jgi:protein-S-isoprenylcysteine O-methyltransferase Ste14